jgi:hypothetical protein
MRSSLRNAIAVLALVLAVSSASAQLVMLPMQTSFSRGRASIFVQPRIVPVSSYGYSTGYYGFTGGAWNAGFAQWWGPPVVYGPPPPIIIQNIIQPPVGGALPAEPAARNGVVIPPEFDPPAVKAPAKAARLGPAAKPPEAAVPAPARPAAQPPGRAEADFITESGTKAFADGQYGRAVELFRKAAEITPNEPSAHYRVAQAQFARGKYHEAVAAIAAGMALRADWSEARFAPRDMYWKKPAAFDDHLNALRHAVTAYPDDPDLLFLLGHQLWFDGKRDEAKAYILKARAIGKGQTPANAFVLK